MAEKKTLPRFNKQIFHLAADKPGITRSEIAERLGISLSKAGSDIGTLTKYSLLSEYPGKSNEVGRHASVFRAHCPMLFRVFDFSNRNCGCVDYTVDGQVTRSVHYPYRDQYPMEANLELYCDRIRQSSPSSANLMCALLLPSPARFVDPLAPIRPVLPNVDELKKRIESMTGYRIHCVADRVSAITRSARTSTGGTASFFGLHLGEEVFSVFLAPGGEPTIRSYGTLLTGNTALDCDEIARTAAVTMYFSGITTWHIYAERKYYAVKEQIQNLYPKGADFPKEVVWDIPFTHYWLLYHLRDRWFDRISADFCKKIASKG